MVKKKKMMGQQFEGNNRRRKIIFQDRERLYDLHVLVGGKELNEQKTKSHFFEWERTRERQEEELVKRQRYIKCCIYSFNKYLLSAHQEPKMGEYPLENKLDIVLSS